MLGHFVAYMDTVKPIILMHNASVFLSFLVMMTGFLFLALGDFQKMKLRYAGMVLSTMCGMYWFVLALVYSDILQCNANSNRCVAVALHQLIRALSVIIFHMVICRDAIRFKRGDRRKGRG